MLSLVESTTIQKCTSMKSKEDNKQKRFEDEHTEDNANKCTFWGGWIS